MKSGLYIEDLSGSQVDITSGKFVFSTKLAYSMEDGKQSLDTTRSAALGLDVL